MTATVVVGMVEVMDDLARKYAAVVERNTNDIMARCHEHDSITHHDRRSCDIRWCLEHDPGGRQRPVALIDPTLKPPHYQTEGALVMIAGGGHGSIIGRTRKYSAWISSYTDRVFVGFGAPESRVGGIVYYDQHLHGRLLVRSNQSIPDRAFA